VAIVKASSRQGIGLRSLLQSLLGLSLALALAMALAGCGGGGGGGDQPPAAMAAPVTTGNVLPLTLDRGTDGTGPFNIPYVTVVICEPGTDSCQSVDHVLVDTGSYGLRIAASAIGSGLSLPPVVNAAAAALGECAQFASGFVWGSVHRADVRLAGERAGGIPIQVVDDPAPAFATVPSGCSRTGANIGVGAGAKGILGVGMLARDCGVSCVSGTAAGFYFACGPSGCAASTAPLASQVANPVAFFASDNNGVVVDLPAVPLGGATALSGSLIFGIETQANNQLGTATVLQANSQGNFTTTYKGVSYPSSFIDSGSNAIFFSDTAIPVCSGFYCPPAPLALSAVNTSATGVSSSVDFTIESIANIASSTAAIDAGADIGLARSFDWGLPFFFGRKVFVAMTGASTSKGTGPFWAY
jgi:hypothetical protein